MLLRLLNDTLLKGANLPKDIYETKKMLKELGLNYNKIDACPNYFMNYSWEIINETSYSVVMQI